MILFDDFGKLLGSDEDSLKLFGCANIEEFKDKIDDISDYFIKKEGYIYKFDNYNWIDFLNYSEEKINKVLIKQKNNQAIEAEISIRELYNLIEINGSKITFLIEFHNKRIVDQTEEKKDIENKENIPEISTKNIHPNKIELNYGIMKKEYDIDEAFYNELLNDFVLESQNDIELINAYIINGKYNSILKITNKLKNICLNLKLDTFLPILSNIEKDIRDKNYERIDKFLDEYTKELDILSRYIDKHKGYL